MSTQIAKPGPRLLPSRIGLRPEHFDEIQHMPMNLKRAAEIVARIRTCYPDNPVVLRHLDMCDPTSEYCEMMELLTRAIQLEKKGEVDRLHACLAIYYGDVNSINCIPIEADDKPDEIEQAWLEGRISPGTGEIIL